jgi:predicted ferric reductase
MSLAAGESPAAPYTTGLTGVNIKMNDVFTVSLVVSFIGLCVLVLLGRFVQMGNAHIRHLFSLTATRQQQSFWARDRSSFWPAVKRNLLYAPLGKKRHNREIQLSSAINIGTLPSRFHTLLLGLYLASNLAYSITLNYSGHTRHQVLAQLRGRTGTLSVINMVPLFVLAGRNNPLIKLLRVSFDTYNLLHRWIGRMVVIEAIVHTFAWGANQVAATGLRGVREKMASNAFIQHGFVATFAMTFILIQAPSAVRHAFYETFLHLHQAAALAAVIGVYFHIRLHALPQMAYIQAVIVIWSLDRLFRLLRILYRCWSFRNGFSNVTVEALPGEASRVTIEVQRPWTFKPGSHVYLYLPSISAHQSHPFSIAWADMQPATPTISSLSSSSSSSSSSSDADASAKEKQLPVSRTDAAGLAKLYPSSISLVVHKRTGMTAALYERAAAAPHGRLTLRGAVEGPYGGLESLHSYGTVVLFAGGIGITHQVAHVRDLLEGYNAGTVATRRVVLVWAVRTTEHLEWVRPWMDRVLQLPNRREVLRVLLFVTKPRSPREVVSPSATVQMFPGRPQPQVILDAEIEERVGAMAVTVCGPGALADGVRHAVRQRVGVASIDFIEEAFTW